MNEVLQATAGLTLPRFKVLQHIDRHGPSRLRDIAAATHVTARTMTETIDWLEQEGLVTRTAHPSDRRALLVVITAIGRERLATSQQRRTEEVTGLTRQLSTGERAEILRLLRSLLEAIPGAHATTDAARAGACPEGNARGASGRDAGGSGEAGGNGG